MIDFCRFGPGTETSLSDGRTAHMDVLTMNRIRTLMDYQGGPAVSLFMPTHRTGAHTQGDAITFKNLLRRARKDLIRFGLRTAEVDEFLHPAQALESDTIFWQHQSDGLAVFLDPDDFQHYRVPMRFAQLVTVGERFHIKPLLPLSTGDGRFYILALSQNQVRLFQGSRFNVNPVEDIGDIPTSLAEVLGPVDAQDQLQFRTGMRDGRGGHQAIYHGQAYESDDARDDLYRFFSQIDRGLREVLGDDQAPLVLAGVEYLLPIYHDANSHPHLLEEGITGNPEHMRPEELHKRAWEIVRPHFRQAEETAARRYRRRAGTGLTSSDICEVVPAAAHGRVGSLFVALGTHLWGSYDEETLTVNFSERRDVQSDDLLDVAAVYTLNRGGTVYAVPQRRVPSDDPVAAVFRY